MNKIKKGLVFSLIIVISFVFSVMSNASKRSTITTRKDVGGKEIRLEIKEGEHWNHRLPLLPWLPFFKIKTTPQIAVWIEDLEGDYLDTLYVTEKTATQSWQKAPGDSTPKEKIRRKSSLPHWTYQRNVKYGDGLYLPTKEKPVADVITSATPEAGFELLSKIEEKYNKVILKVEINNSTDFNKYYPKDAKKGDANYSGGEWGSGQPAIVYATTVNLKGDKKFYSLQAIGHSSPNGENGKLYPDLSKLTTAKGIIKDISVEIR
ncbi:hypothetical protein [Orenia metallireducens]|uniref:hypothetical protein n=1 Tax=Orenia metallireducens TaxID=1413210 RepID=UPI0009F3EAE5|nr:hypothetical protein [Orenia metallireducens]